MTSADHILILLVLTAVSSLLTRASSGRVPLPLLQIAIGVVAALCGLRIGLRPDLFMLVFLPPLLFADAFRMPLREFGELRGTILFLAFGLVVFSTVLCGYVIHWIVPQLDLAICFTLAAALSPTDTVAVSSLTAGRRVPERLLHILSGEALFNDASGLVCFRFATAAVMTGEFSYRQAFGSFLLVSLGGLAIGALMAWAASRAERILLRRGFDDPPLQITLIVLLPFVIYVVAEAAGCSGILASVAGCMVVKLSGVVEEAATATRLQATTVWTMVSYVFNALIFLLLGLQLPALLNTGMAMAHEHHATMWQLSGLVAMVYVIMLVLRFVGIWLSILRRWIGKRMERQSFIFPSVAGTVLMTIAGVRGAVTLAAVLSLPVVDVGIEAFPARDLVISVATGVIVLSLVVAGVVMPFCIRFLPKDGVDKSAMEENVARQRLVRAVLRQLRQEQSTAAQTMAEEKPGEDKLRLEVVGRLLQTYENRLSQIDETPQIPVMNRTNALRRERIELALRLLLLRTERQTLRDLAHSREINDRTEWELQQELDYEEQVLRNRVQRLPKDI
ncbi:Na+/H+ antiporter [Neoasaia chiangmaiensis NBRC 101099]|uniref:Na+/H+ antiporter n=1 Tax=Neoasaia chiangmaiensis TaxID=320497 RepID=A0A1U9KV29_9PROT|nr:Na+/H+ antiporter [Neoasaia chiangmaiensis]AQS89547.1 Na+/H+ antiporter [Neoasaia chiangmaiensis]GBR40691.1 Na+/H+ antiporter [Neoasaia chiangmaiensis NBRC 101099]GEN13785.1 Na+/H+ antiporter [Neoasaia chiangmaiensis]